MRVSCLLSHMLKFSILFTPPESDLETWFAAAALWQQSGSGEETSLPVAPGEEGPEGFRLGRGLYSVGLTVLRFTCEAWVSCLGPKHRLILRVSRKRAAQSDPTWAHPFPVDSLSPGSMSRARSQAPPLRGSLQPRCPGGGQLAQHTGPKLEPFLSE